MQVMHLSRKRNRKRTSFAREELPALYAMRNFLPNGQRPEGRTFAMTYWQLAKFYGCDADIVGDACVLAADYVRSGMILKFRDGKWHFMKDSYGDLEAAELLGVCYMTVRRWAERGILDPSGNDGWRVTGNSIAQVLRGVRQRPKRGRPFAKKGGA